MEYAKASTTSLLNSEPLKSYKPSPDIIWKSYALYTILGAGSVIPWYAIITNVDYFEFRYPNVHIIRVLSVVYLVGWFLCFTLSSPFCRQYTSWVRISAGLIVSAIAVVSIPVVDAGFITGQQGTDATLYATIAAAVIAGAADALAQGSVLSIAAELPHRFTRAIVLGFGASGVLVFIVQVITKLIVSMTLNSIRYSAIIHFTLAAFFIVIVLGAFAYVHRMPVMDYYNSLGLGSSDTVRLLLEDEASVTLEITSAAAIASVAAGRPASVRKLVYQPVLKKIQFLAVALVLVSIVSLLIFPGLLIEDVYSYELPGWYSITLIGTYIVFDLLGRGITVIFSQTEKQWILLGGASARIVLVVFFALAVVGMKIFRTEIAVFIFTALLGLSNGYFVACLTIIMPRIVSSTEWETAGVIMGLVSGFGCLLGAALSWLWIIV